MNKHTYNQSLGGSGRISKGKIMANKIGESTIYIHLPNKKKQTSEQKLQEKETYYLESNRKGNQQMSLCLV